MTAQRHGDSRVAGRGGRARAILTQSVGPILSCKGLLAQTYGSASRFWLPIIQPPGYFLHRVLAHLLGLTQPKVPHTSKQETEGKGPFHVSQCQGGAELTLRLTPTQNISYQLHFFIKVLKYKITVWHSVLRI